jgi:hypothetical protein
VAPFTHLTQKDQHFSWEVEVHNAFQFLKVFFMTAPFSSYVNPFKPFVLKTDDSNSIVGIIFSQLREDNLFHLLDFRSCKFSLVEINYKIRDKELLAIVNAFEEWHHLFEKVQHEIIVYSNHKNLQYFMTTHVRKINTKHSGHHPCHDYGLSSQIAFGANKGNLMCYPIIHTSCIKREM